MRMRDMRMRNLPAALAGALSRALSRAPAAALLAALPAALASALPISAAELRGHGGPVRALAVDEAGAVLSGSFDTRAILWAPETGAALRVMRLHEGSVTAAAFLPEGGLATGGQEGRVALWPAEAGAPAAVVAEHDGPVTALALAPDGAALASSGWDGTVRIADLRTGDVEVLEGAARNVNGVGFLPDGGVVAIDYEGGLRIWPSGGGPARSIELGVPLNALAIGGFRVFAAGADGAVRVFDESGAAQGRAALGPAPLAALALAPDGDALAAAAVDGTVTVLDTQTLGVRAVIPASSGAVWAVAFADDATILAAGADNVVRPWAAETGAPLGQTREAAAAEPLGDSQGARVFRMCAACHTLGPDDGNRAGPTLHGIFGRRIASAEGFHYSEALKGMDLVWTPETVARLFEIGPAAMTPGTSMPEQRITDPDDRAALVAFLAAHTR